MPAAHAGDISALQTLTQSEFRLLSEDLGAALSFKPMIPAESMGITGFDIGVAATGTKVKNTAAWEKATADAGAPSTLPLAMLRVHKGLPFDIDIGASYAALPSSNVKVIGGELRWALVAGSMAVPAVALRASASSLTGVDQLDLRTIGLDVSVSKGFAMLTPYAGIGTVSVRSKPQASSGLASEKFSKTKVFGGVNLNLGLTNIVLETDRTGDATSYGVKVGFRF